MTLLELVQELIRIKSISPKDNGCFDVIENKLVDLNFDVQKINYSNVENLLARYGSSGPVFCFLGHTDVVPEGPIDQWSFPPFAAEVNENILYGRGAADMKSSIAAFMIAAKEFLKLNPNPDFQIWILLTSNEEGEKEDGKIDKIIDDLTQEGKFIDYCLVGEASSSNIVGDTLRRGRRGSLTGYLKVIGKQGHVAYPKKVINPIHLSGEVIRILSEEVWDEGNEFFEPTSFQISNISGGTGATNVVPNSLDLVFNLRFSPESTADSLKNRILEIFEANNLNYEISWVKNADPYFTKENKFIDTIQKAIKKINGSEAIIDNGGGTSDGRWVAPMGSQVVELGPLNKTIHQINENIPIHDLEKVKDIYLQILQEVGTS